MNNSGIIVSASLLKHHNITLTWQELLWGLSNKYITAKDIVEYSCNLLEELNSHDESLIELCGMSNQELHLVRPLLEKLAGNEKDFDEKPISSKLLYLVLQALYDKKEEIGTLSIL